MNREDIIRMARECFADPDGSLVLLTPELSRFAALVAAAEREACAKVCERLPAQQDIDVRDQCAAALRARGKNAHR